MRRVMFIGTIAALAVLGAPFGGAPSASAAATYQRVCETTGLSQTRNGADTYTVYAGNNVNVRGISKGMAEINYPTRGFIDASALCSRR